MLFFKWLLIIMHIIAIPLAINCRDGIYAVRAKTYECNDGRKTRKKV